ncbi:hypothetical protein [Pseudomonas fluorescens]|uniref:Uncharacterized protein n=1 Tax=Pseudomonas fluorescens TaxID=294 RepID=A0A5E7G856_PSEFL|nr:hypothetical protein [Pseudomonas fluorescens]VVO47941.1 hypothetical protein PS880_00146 [Pseudomonas fluorescens]
MNPTLSSFLSASKYQNVTLSDGANHEPTLKIGFFEGRSIACFTDHETNQIKNDCTKGMFFSALGKEYGADIALSLVSQLEMNTTKPLSGRVIHAVVAQAEAEAKAMAMAIASFNKVAVSDFIRDPNGATPLLQTYSDQGWFGKAELNHFRQVLTAEAAKSGHPLKQVEIKALAEAMLNRIRGLEQAIHTDFSQLSVAFQSSSHVTILAALDQLAEHLHLRAQLDISGTLSTETESGTDDKFQYQHRVMATLLNALSADEKKALFELILNHPTSKEVTQLGGGAGFAMNVTDAMETSNVAQSEQIVWLNTLCRTATTLDALISTLDKQISHSEEGSPRFQTWLGDHASGDSAGQIEYADPAFANAFVQLQRNHNGLDPARCGFSDIGSGDHCKKYLVIATDDKFMRDLSELANSGGQTAAPQYLKDFNRSTYYVNGQQVSRNVDKNGDPDSTMDNRDAVPPIATHFANQVIFGDIPRLLFEQHGIVLIDAHEKYDTTYSLQLLSNNDIQLHFSHKARAAILMKGDLQEKLDENKSSSNAEINILIQQKDGKVSATLSSPIIYEYRAVPE